MSDVNNLEALKQRKEQLLLEQEVARLERRQKMSKAGGWAWWWVAPMAALGLLMLIVGLNEAHAASLAASIFLLAPVSMKLFFKK